MNAEWGKAPMWAKFIAMDKSGKWYWFEERPVRVADEWMCSSGEFLIADHGIDWECSLESRL